MAAGGGLLPFTSIGDALLFYFAMLVLPLSGLGAVAYVLLRR